MIRQPPQQAGPAAGSPLAAILSKLQGGASINPQLLQFFQQRLGLQGASQNDFNYQDGQAGGGNWFTRANPNGTFDDFRNAALNMQLQQAIQNQGGTWGNAMIQRLANGLGVQAGQGGWGGVARPNQGPPGSVPPQGPPGGPPPGASDAGRFGGTSQGPARAGGLTQQPMDPNAPLQGPSGPGGGNAAGQSGGPPRRGGMQPTARPGGMGGDNANVSGLNGPTNPNPAGPTDLNRPPAAKRSPRTVNSRRGFGSGRNYG